MFLDKSVSIHAPARGATYDKGKRHQLILVSIHAPARGATPIFLMANHTFACFNPRARTGRDLDKLKFMLIIFQSFNPRARTGRDGKIEGLKI